MANFGDDDGDIVFDDASADLDQVADVDDGQGENGGE